MSDLLVTPAGATSDMLVTYNGESVARAAIPRLPLERFREVVISAPREGRRISALFGCPGAQGPEMIVVRTADHEGLLEVAATALPDEFASMTPECPQVHLFEREIAEQWGSRPAGHPWLKPVRFHAGAREPGDRPAPGVTDFFRVEGEEIHEVAVGPVHAGVIEPGHFRFQCHGEHVFHLEIALGYQHRGVEKALVGGPGKRTVHYMETLAGDTTVGHTTAYCQILEALGGVTGAARGLGLRGIALELERLANHTGDLGALAGDIGFLPTASYCGRLRGDFLNLTALLCGNRYSRGLVRPGGIAFDLDAARAVEMVQRLRAARSDVESAVALLWNSASVQARFDDTGRVSEETARELGLVGVAARACGLRIDVRKQHPTGVWCFAHVPVSTWHTGDVFARAYVRWLEIRRSVEYIRAQIRELADGPIRTACPPPAPDRFCASLVEGWRGEICHVALTGPDSRFTAYKVVDPSFHNWAGVAMAVRDQQISDFPLCNKSFNLSYCGHDL